MNTFEVNRRPEGPIEDEAVRDLRIEVDNLKLTLGTLTIGGVGNNMSDADAEKLREAVTALQQATATIEHVVANSH